MKCLHNSLLKVFLLTPDATAEQFFRAYFLFFGVTLYLFLPQNALAILFLSSCTFPYNYLVTTSSQLAPSLRHSSAFPLTRNNRTSNLRPDTFQTVMGSLYKAPVLIHRNIADLRLLVIPSSCFQVADSNLNYGNF